jgi:hypothetical protein
LQSSGDIRPIDQIEAELDEIGVADGVARTAQRLHRLASDHGTQLRSDHRSNTPQKRKKPPQLGAEEARCISVPAVRQSSG